MDMVLRCVIGLLAAFMLVYGLGFWFQTDMMNARFALATQNDLGFASIRADFASFFLSVGLFAGYAAWKRSSCAALAAATLLGLAFVGRAISLLFEGPVAGGVPPMTFEAVATAILLFARSRWGQV